MAEERKLMRSALNQVVVPWLRERGFTGSFPHFRRLGTHQIDLATFQLAQRGGGLVVELARAPFETFVTPWGAKIEPKKLTAHDLNPRRRYRLGSGPVGDHWCRYDDGTSHAAAARRVLSDLMSDGLAWWQLGENPQ